MRKKTIPMCVFLFPYYAIRNPPTPSLSLVTSREACKQPPKIIRSFAHCDIRDPPSQHRCIGHAGMRYRNGGLELSNLSHHLCGLCSLLLRMSSEIVVLSSQSLQLLPNVIAGATTRSSLSLRARLRIFTVFLGLRAIWNNAI